MNDSISFGKVDKVKYKGEDHIPSKIQADTLFTFTTKLKYLVSDLKNSCLYPRYCIEDLKYLDISNLQRIAIPMKCFCDINLMCMYYASGSNDPEDNDLSLLIQSFASTFVGVSAAKGLLPKFLI